MELRNVIALRKDEDAPGGVGGMIQIKDTDLVKARLAEGIEAAIFDLDGVLINSPLDFGIISLSGSKLAWSLQSCCCK